MARPNKAGIDYFPLDVFMEQDDKIGLIEAKYGITGFGVIIKLYKKIYADKGYYYEWNEKTKLLFSKYALVDYQKIDEIVHDAIEWDLFDKSLFTKYGILTSKRIQKTYFDASSRKKQIEIVKEYLLNGVNEYINKVNVVINSKNEDINPQIKLNKNKLNKNKYADYVFMFPEEYQKLINQYGEIYAKRFIDKLNAFKGSKGKTYKSDYLAILNWVVEAVMGAEKKREAEARYHEGLEREKEWQRRKEKRNEPIPEKVKEQINKILKPVNY